MSQPVLGMLDWGVGGLSVLSALQRMGVGGQVLYASDTASPPYGLLSERELARQVQRVCSRLLAMGAERVVVACNAASTTLHLVSAPTLGVIECGLQAARESGLERLAVLGGARTIASHAYALGLPELQVSEHVAQPLSALVEAGRLDGPGVRAAVARVLEGVGAAQGLVLACTHYPALSHHFRALRPDLELLDPGQRTAQRLAESLPAGRLQVRFFSSGDAGAMQRAALAGFGVEIPSVEALWAC